MAAYVGSSTGQNTANNNSVSTAGLDVTSGNMLAGCFASQEPGPTHTYSDGVAYTEANAGSGSFAVAKIAYRANIATETGNVLTATASGNHRYKYLAEVEYSGLDTTSPLDDSDTAEAAAATFIETPAMTASTSGVIVGVATSSNDRTWTVGTSFTERVDTFGSFFVEDRVIASSGSYTASATASSASNISITGAIFKDAAAGGDPEFGLLGGKLIGGGMLIGGMLKR